MKGCGYQIILPPENMADHLGFGGGLDIYKQIKVKKTLSNGYEEDFTNQIGYAEKKSYCVSRDDTTLR